MSRNIWVISDTHYNQRSILSFIDYSGRPVREFDNVDQMNECILTGWNSVVHPNDIVYHLGDVFHDHSTEDRNKFERDWPKFNGHKRLILGNHDDVRYLSGKDSRGNWLFEKVMYWRRFQEYGIHMTHAPIHQSGLYVGSDKTLLCNVHGHIHTNDTPPGPYINVCVEKLNYTPINIEQLALIAKKEIYNE